MRMDTDSAIRSRRTEKVLAERELPVKDSANQRALLEEILFLAGQAPFHRACEEQHRHSGGLTGIEPWRFYAIDAAACRKLRRQIPQENAGKIPAMLAAADALIIATWLPNAGEAPPLEEEPGFAATLTNMEHIAATAAAIENLLLAATARGISNYWSSGGVLRSRTVRELLAIPAAEMVLGAIFLFPKEIAGAELATSKLRQHRGSLDKWCRWVELPE
jgi:nitroreductase